MSQKTYTPQSAIDGIRKHIKNINHTTLDMITHTKNKHFSTDLSVSKIYSLYKQKVANPDLLPLACMLF